MTLSLKMLGNTRVLMKTVYTKKLHVQCGRANHTQHVSTSSIDLPMLLLVLPSQFALLTMVFTVDRKG